MINTNIINLSTQGFSCVPIKKSYTNRYGTYDKVPFFKSEACDRFPSQGAAIRGSITVEAWKKICDDPDFQRDVGKVAICGGHNGVVVFDFDVKEREKEDRDAITRFWEPFVEFISKKTNGEFYRETTPSGGEHLIFLIDDKEKFRDIRSNSNLAVYKKRGEANWAFVETFGFPLRNTDGDAAKFCIVAPSPGYKQIGGKSITSLSRVSASIYDEAIDYWSIFRPADKPNKDSPKKEIDLVNRLNLIQEINRRYNMEDILRSKGYRDCGGGRFIPPGSTSGTPGVLVQDNKVFSHHASDPLNNGRWNDAFEALHLLEGIDKSTLFKMECEKWNLDTRSSYRKEAEEKRQERKKEFVEEVLKDGNSTKIVEKVFIDDDGDHRYKLNTGTSTVFLDEETLSNSNAFNAFALRHYPAAHSERGEFKYLKHLIVKEIGQIKVNKKEISASTSAKWVKNKFKHQKDDDFYIEHELIKSAGSLNIWRERVANKIEKYPGMVLPLVLGFAGPFVGKLHQSFGINLVGESGIGKTLSMMLASSVYGKKDYEKWISTNACLREYLRYHENTCACVDELRSANKEMINEIIDICSDVRKKKCEYKNGRMTISLGMKKQPIIVLSSSEDTFVRCARRQKVEITKGFTNRFMDIEVEEKDFCSAAEQVKIQKVLEEHYGVGLKYFLDQIDIDELEEEYEEYSNRILSKIESKDDMRSVGHFIFLGFIAKKLQDTGVIDYCAEDIIYKLFKRKFFYENLQCDASEAKEILERMNMMLNTSEFTCRNVEGSKPGPKNCFFTDVKAKNPTPGSEESCKESVTVMQSVPFCETIRSEFGIGSIKALKILRDTGVIRNVRQVKLFHLGIWKDVYEVNTELLDQLFEIKSEEKESKIDTSKYLHDE